MFELEETMIDRRNWALGIYFESAIGTVIEHCFSKNAKSEYISKPFTHKEKNEEDMSEEEKIRITKQLFTQLKVMQSNFNIEKNRKEKNIEKRKNPYANDKG